MQIAWRKIFRRVSLLIIEAFLAISVLGVIASCFFIWRISSSPLEIEFARSSVEQALRDASDQVNVKMDKIYIHLPELRGPLMLGLRGGALYNKQDQELLSVDEVAIGLNKANLVFGQFRPEALLIYSPQINFTRTGAKEFDIDIAGSSDDLSIDQPGEGEDTAIFERILDYVSADGEAGASAYSYLKRVEILDASFHIDDQYIGVDWVLPQAGLAVERVDEGLRAELALSIPHDDGVSPSATLEAAALLHERSKNMDIDVSLEAFMPSMLASKFEELSILSEQKGTVDLKLKAELDETAQLISAEVAVLSERGELNLDALSEGAVPYKELGAMASYDALAGTLKLEQVQITLKDVAFKASADLVLKAALGQGDFAGRGPIRLSVDEVSQDELASLWPAALKGDNSEKWIVQRMSNGVFRDVYAQGDLVIDSALEENSVDIEGLIAGFAFDGMTVNYRDPLPALVGGKGEGRFDLAKESLEISVTEGYLGGLSVHEGALVFSNIIEKGAGGADLKIGLKGGFKAVLDYVAQEPIAVKPDFNAGGAAGSVDLNVHVNFPTKADLPKDEVKIDVEGKLSEARIPAVVKGLDLTGGPYDVSVKDGLFSVAGKGALDGRAIELSYSEYLSAAGKPYSSRVKARLNADQKLREKFGIDLSVFLSGPAYVDVNYTAYQDKRSEALVSADLKNSVINIEPFDYRKDAGVAAQAKLTALLQAGVLKEIRGLSASAPSLSVERAKLGFRGAGDNTALAGGNVSSFVLDQSRGAAEFEIDQSGKIMIEMDGQAFDLRPFLNNEKKDDEDYESDSMQVSIKADRMFTAEDQQVRNVSMYIDINKQGRFNQLELDGVAGKGAIYLRFKPDNQGKRTFHFEADDAGATLKVFDLFSSMQGGKMVIYAEPIRSVYDRNLIGKAEITNFKVVGAPVLARLLGVMSLSGVLQSLSGEGINFQKMAADFDWLYRPEGSLLVLKDGRTSGNSLGLTFDGTFDNAAQTLDVAGTVIPLSGINKAIGSIPLVGDILTGGTGSLFAATYTMKGRAAEAEVSVNPLSVLTPGILRRILFEEN